MNREEALRQILILAKEQGLDVLVTQPPKLTCTYCNGSGREPLRFAIFDKTRTQRCHCTVVRDSSMGKR